MKKIIILIGIFCLIHSVGYTAPTVYDKKQDKKISTNKTNIKENNQDIKQNVRSINDNTDYINTVDTDQTNWNNRQGNTLTDHNNRITDNTNRLNDHDNRIDTLEDTQYNIAGEINILQGRRHKVGVYTKYNTNRNMIGEVGVRFTYDLDLSWSVKEIDKINTKLEKITAQLNKTNIQTETVQLSENKYRIQIKDKGNNK